MAKKTWNEKLNDSGNMPYVADIDCKFAQKFGPRMLVAPPLAYNAFMSEVPPGKILTIEQMRTVLAKKYHADWTCFMTAGMFVNICANAAEERGDKEFPYWRTVKTGGELCEKFPGGLEAHKMLLEIEGHKIIQKGKRYFVENYESKLFKI